MTRLKIIYDEVLFTPPITNSHQAYRELMNVWDMSTIKLIERAYVMFLNGANRAICYFDIDTGTQKQTDINIKLCLGCALGCMASKVIISHSHPSGNLKPSALDIEKTKRFKDACNLLDIELSDHLIVTDKGYYSFLDNGKL